MHGMHEVVHDWRGIVQVVHGWPPEGPFRHHEAAHTRGLAQR